MSTISGHSIVETLFESRRSIIYRATREADGRAVVLKVLNAEYPTLDQTARLRREYRMTKGAGVDGVIGVFSLEKYKTSAAIVMDDFGGESLSRIAASGPIELRRILGLAARLAGTLGRIHQMRIIHKDINPSNIVWNEATDVVKLIDFGISTELSRETQAVQSPSVLEGTLAYMSPEQTGRMNRALDYRTDLYSLGATLYQLLTGQPPFVSGDPMELVHRHIAAVPAPPHEVRPDTPEVVSAIVSRLLAKRAEDRYQSAFVLESDLRRCLEGLDAKGRVGAFTIGEGDVSGRFQLPQKLYGREREIEALLAAFGRAGRGGREMRMVAGYSGIGKSALVHEVHRPIVEKRGYFISGKFDQYSRDIPYASLIQAFQALCRQLLSEPPAELARVRERLLGALGPNARVILDVIPEVELIVGAQPPMPELPPREAQNRFNLTFERFVRAFAGPSHPLVVFLDDLQWADLPSLQLIERLMTDVGTSHLLLIGAYRDNEVSASHPLIHSLEAMREVGAAIDTVTLSPLDEGHCAELLADLLGSDAATVGPLSRACQQKTGGNPFFLGQFLLSLHEDGQFEFDGRRGVWRWDLDRIAGMALTDNVVDLMASKIQKLSPEAQRVLRLAACIGNRFDLGTLAVVDARPASETADALWAGIREGLVLPLDESYKFLEDRAAVASLVSQGQVAGEEQVRYRFLHDRVQQAAYSLIPDEDKPALHLQVGRLILGSAGPEEREERLFEIVNHLNQGIALVASQAERDELAEWNLAAGKKAKASAAHAAASRHLEVGIALLGEQRWQRRYRLTLDLHVNAAEASHLNTEFEQMERYAAEALEHASGALDVVRVEETRIQAYGTQNKFVEALGLARRLLSRIGVHFPEGPTAADFTAELEETRAILAGGPIEALLELPAMSDPERLAALRILAMAIPNAYLAEPALFPLIALRQVALSARYGNTGASSFGYAAFGILLCGPLGDIDSGNRFGELAVRVVERYNAKEYEGRTRYLVAGFMRHWMEHARESGRAFKDIYQICLDTGDLDFAGYAANLHVAHAYLSGSELGELIASTAGYLEELVRRKHAPGTHWTMLIRQVAENLRGDSLDPCRLVGTECDEDRMLAVFLEVKDAYGLGCLYAYKTQLCYLFGRHAEALAYAAQGEGYHDGMIATLQVPSFQMYGSLARLAACPGATDEERERLLGEVAMRQEQMKVWAEHAPMNHAHKLWLVEAERARVTGEPERAMGLYHRAITLAREHEYTSEEALATELFARFWLEREEAEVAQLFLAKARHLYRLWGAAAKVSDLEARYPELLSRAARSVPGHRLDLGATTTDESADAPLALDVVSVLKASQAISGEVVLTELLEKMMHIVIENAGAQRGLLILEGESPLVVETDRSSGDRTLFTPGAQVEDRIDLAQAVVRYVRRTHRTVVLGDAATGPFHADPHVSRSALKSVLCQPIIHQKKLVALLYLENNLVANAFTPDRCRVLDLLAAQAAISLENARLYETLDNRVKARTAELTEALADLRRTQQQLVQKEKLAALGMLTSGIAHEIKNPLNFINNFAELSAGLTDELTDELGRGPAPLGPGSAVQEILDDLRGNLLKINEHGARANGIVRAMLDHAKTVGGERQEIDLNQVLSEHVNRAREVFEQQCPGFVVPLEEDLDPRLPRMHLSPQELGRVFQNLAANAFYAVRARRMQLGDGFSPAIRISTRNAEGHVEIRLRDNGGGVPASIRDKIMSPFFTTKPPGKGAGLGLSLSFDIVVQGNGGSLEFETDERDYTEFVVVLPKRAPDRNTLPPRP